MLSDLPKVTQLVNNGLEIWKLGLISFQSLFLWMEKHRINVKNLDPLLESSANKLCELGEVLPFHWNLDFCSVNEENWAGSAMPMCDPQMGTIPSSVPACPTSFPGTQSASFSTLNSLQSVSKVNSCSSTGFNLCRGRWQIPLAGTSL